MALGIYSWVWLWVLRCLLAATGSRAQPDIPGAIQSHVALWLPLHGQDAPLTTIVPNGTMTASVRSDLSGPGDVLWEEDAFFGRVYRCGSTSGSFLELDGFEGMVAAPSSFAASFWFRTDTFNTSSPQTLVVIPTGANTHVSVWLSPDGDVCVGDGCTSGLELRDGDWHHVTITSVAGDGEDGSGEDGSGEDGSGENEAFDVFVGGVAVSRGTFVASTVDNDTNSSSMLVCASAYQDEVLDGQVVDLVVFDRGLSDEEVVLNYNLRNNPFAGSSLAAQNYAAPTAARPLCSDVPIAGIITATDCGVDYDCYKVHPRQLSLLDNTLALNELSGRVGLCVPKSMTDKLPDPTIVPPAAAFFPLTINQLWSYPLGVYKGDGRGVSLVPDTLFGQVLYCNGEDGFVGLDTVPYGFGGRFSINLWFKPDAISDKEHSWLFSHGANGQDPMGADQVQIYLTNKKEDGGADYGHVSALVHDSSDQQSLLGGVDPVPILNADGTVGEFLRRDGEDGTEQDVLDGDWHMVTLTTNPVSPDNPDGKGYILYVDGKEVNRLGADTDARNIIGQDFLVQGGDMLLIMNEMFLCGRGYEHEETFPFHGQLAYLSIWDSTLDPRQIEVLYDTVARYGLRGTSRGLGPNEADQLTVYTPDVARIQRATMSGKQCQFPAIYAGALVNDCVSYADGSQRCRVEGGRWEVCADDAENGSSGTLNDTDPDLSTSEGRRASIEDRTRPGGQMEYCLLSEWPRDAASGSPRGCSDGHTCVPLEEGHDYVEDEDLGMCMRTPSAIARFDLFNYLHRMKMAQPLSLYPLIDESLTEVTLPSNTAIAEDISWRWSRAFQAQVPTCAINTSIIRLIAGTTKNAEHTECVWFAVLPPGDSITPGIDGGYTLPERQVVMSHDMLDIVLDVVPRTNDQYILSVLGADGTRFDTTYEVSSAASTIMSDHEMGDNEAWHMVCVSATTESDVTTVQLYLDGRHVRTLAGQETSGMHDGIGEVSQVSLCPALNGHVSQYVSFGRALAAEDIRMLYALFEEAGIAQGVLDDDFYDEFYGNQNGGEDDGGLSGGAIAGVVIVSLLGAALLVATAILLLRRWNRNKPKTFKRYKDSNVVMPNDDDVDFHNGERSLREQFSAYYSASELSGSGGLTGSLSRDFSYEYDRNEPMAIANPTFEVDHGLKHAEPAAVSTPDVTPASIDGDTSTGSSDIAQ